MEMKSLLSRKSILILIGLFLAACICQAQSFDRPAPPRQQKSTSSNRIRQKNTRVRGPKAVERAKKKQEANDRKLKKEYKDFVEENKKRSLEIQTPEVRERMKQNVKNANAGYKAKRKNQSAATRRAARKYKR
jgi:hypothetical protein